VVSARQSRVFLDNCATNLFNDARDLLEGAYSVGVASKDVKRHLVDGFQAWGDKSTGLVLWETLTVRNVGLECVRDGDLLVVLERFHCHLFTRVG